MCSQKECPTKFETRRLQEIPFSKELTDNYCALGLLFESKICNNNNNKSPDKLLQLRNLMEFNVETNENSKLIFIHFHIFHVTLMQILVI